MLSNGPSPNPTATMARGYSDALTIAPVTTPVAANHISNYRFKKVIVDTSLYMCNYKASYQEKWIGAFIKLISLFRENDVHCSFSYDTGFPAEKQEERKERMDNRNKIEEKIFNVEEAIEKYHRDGIVDQILLDFQDKRKIRPPMLGKSDAVNIKAVEFHLDKMKKQMFTITNEDYELTRQLFKILEIPYFYAPMEAETLCADLCLQGKVDAVLTEDTDVLAYGSPVFLSKINVNSGTCMRINQEELLKEMGFTQDQFLDFCIMCGTDYNKNIFRVGPAKAFSYISEYKTIEAVAEKTGLDIRK